MARQADILKQLPAEDATNYRIQNKLLFQELNKTMIKDCVHEH